MKYENFKRRVTNNFRLIGRNFLKGDIIILNNNMLDHYYVYEGDVNAIIDFDCSIIHPDTIDKIKANSEVLL